ncbi:MAG: hypothetical protein WD100_04135 [Tistlia sp.]
MTTITLFLDRHRQAPHFARFGRESLGLIRAKRIDIGTPSPSAPASRRG